MNVPSCTYRLQFNSQFSFNDAKKVVGYLKKLGISAIYASPIFKARKGSTHGYDIVNPQELNPDLGSRVDFDHLVKEVTSLSMGWIQDIVPNHMAIDSENEFLMDIFENGPISPAYNYFDIIWDHVYEGLRGKLLVPVLGSPYAECLEEGQIRLSYNGDGFYLGYYDFRFPLKIETYASILEHDLERLRKDLGSSHSGLIKLLGILYFVKNVHSQSDYQQRKGQISFAKAMLREIYNGDPTIKGFINDNVRFFNGTVGKPETFAMLDNLHAEQFFKLAFWKVATEELNYRRFFTVNDLISIRAEEQNVFTDSHALIIDLVVRGFFSGLRVDHIDGLYNPRQYLQRLRDVTGDIYLVVEKILSYDEHLKADWPVQGTTGYDFLNMVAGIFCNRANKRKFDKIYSGFTSVTCSFDKLLIQKKRLIISRHMAGDIDNLALLIKRVSSKDRRGTDMTLYGLRNALVELIASFPVYRTYIDSETISPEDLYWLNLTFRIVKRNTPQLTREIEFIERYLLLQFEFYATEQTKREWVNVIMRFQQFCGPLMAKGFEDTMLYFYNRLIALNDVGGFPELFGIESGKFHAFNVKRLESCRFTLNTTSTHDTKRGEDARMRLCVISELPEEWSQLLRQFSKINKVYKTHILDEYQPDRNDEYLFYQTLLSAWPLEGSSEAFVQRICDYMLKAVREEKAHTGWIKPALEYEEALISFVKNVLHREKNREFFSLFAPFQNKIAWYGVFNSLSQLIIKCCSPGIPDFYQGTETWDLSLVDPDNRRKVDFGHREKILAGLSSLSSEQQNSFLRQEMQNPLGGNLKFFTLFHLLKVRNEKKSVFNCGNYSKLKCTGTHKNSVFAFSRSFKDEILLVIVPRMITRVVSHGVLPLGADVWKDTKVNVGGNFQNGLYHLFTKNGVSVDLEGGVSVGDAFIDYPGAVLVGKHKKVSFGV